VKAKLLTNEAEKTYAVVLDKGEEVTDCIVRFAREHELGGSHFTAIGAFSNATVGFFDRYRRDYLKIPIHEQVEVLSLIGDIALNGNEPQLHAHVVLGRRDGAALGGHLLEAHVWPTLEVVLTESPRHLVRVHDPETGLALLAGMEDAA